MYVNIYLDIFGKRELRSTSLRDQDNTKRPHRQNSTRQTTAHVNKPWMHKTLHICIERDLYLHLHWSPKHEPRNTNKNDPTATTTATAATHNPAT